VPILAAYAILEIMAGLALLTLPDRIWRSEGPSSGTTTEATGRIGPEALHPYWGWVLDPSANSAGLTAFHRTPISSWGFLDEGPPIDRTPPTRARFAVGLFGGSMAHWTSVEGWSDLEAELRGSAAIGEREIRPIRTALGGYKQPQQLLILAYLLASGAQFDLIVNLDGYNEVVLTALDLGPRGVTLSFPRSWPDLVGQTGGVERARRIGRIEFLKEWAARVERLSGRSPWRYSPVARIGLRLTDRWISGQLAEERLAMTLKETGGSDAFAAAGPDRPIGLDQAEMLRRAGETWSRSSLQMAALARSSGAAYVHVLQPNQYLRGSKPMGGDEAAKALALESQFGEVVRSGYAELRRRAIADLQPAGVAFLDLTGVFAQTREARYRDPCCHVTPQGSREIGAAIGRFARSVLDANPVEKSNAAVR
jgi:hypothetical protein